MSISQNNCGACALQDNNHGRCVRIAFLGGGNMSSAVLDGLLADGFAPQCLAVMDRHPEKLARFAAQGVAAHLEPGAWLSEVDVVVLGVKPQGLEACIKAAAPFVNKSALIVSMAAAVSVRALQGWLPNPVVRTMPNTPAKVKKGMTALFASADATDAHKLLAEDVMRAVGRVDWVEREEDLHLVTGGTGSGPAYVFLFMQGLAEALVREGLSPEHARELSLSTVEGAAALARATGEDFAVLRANVTSKGGTTAKAIEAFEAHDLRGIIAEAVAACVARSREMAGLFQGSSQ